MSGARKEVLAELRGGERFLLVTHENPDGDALGSLVAMHGLLRELRKDALMFLGAGDFPLPYEYRFLRLDDLVTEAPADLADRTVIFLDCGNADRSPIEPAGAHVVNIDHHHDNTRFGQVNHVVDDASCTAEIVWHLFNALGVRPGGDVADALYIGLVTDTGRFMYENTGPEAHRMAVDLIDCGVDVSALYRRLYEGMPFAKLELLGRALSKIERHDEGRLTMAFLGVDDYVATGAEESYSEGVIDHLRAVAGTKVAVLVRSLLGDDRRGSKKVSLRSTDGEVDVSAIARSLGGGGHRRAAGFSTELADDEIVAFVREAVAQQLGEPV